MKRTIVPTLIPLGFEGEDLNFIRKLNDIVQVFRINTYEKSYEKITFTFLFGFYSFKVYKILNSDFDHKFPKIWHCFASFDINHFTQSSPYEVNSQLEQDILITKAKGDIETYVLPIFSDISQFDEFNKLMFYKNPSPQFLTKPYSESVYCLITGDRDKGVAELKLLYKQYSKSPAENAFKLWDLKRISTHFGFDLSEGGS